MLEFEYPWAFAVAPLALLAWWALPAYRESRESVRVPFFEKVAGATGSTPDRGGVLMRRNLLQMVLAPIALLLLGHRTRTPAVRRAADREDRVGARPAARRRPLRFDGHLRHVRTPRGNRITRIEAVRQVLDDFVGEA